MSWCCVVVCLLLSGRCAIANFNVAVVICHLCNFYPAHLGDLLTGAIGGRQLRMGRCSANRHRRQYETGEGVTETDLAGYMDLRLRVPSNSSNCNHDRTVCKPLGRSVGRAVAPLSPSRLEVPSISRSGSNLKPAWHSLVYWSCHAPNARMP